MGGWDFFPSLVDGVKLVPVIYFVTNLSRLVTSYCFPQDDICATFSNMHAIYCCFLLEKMSVKEFFYQCLYPLSENV